MVLGENVKNMTVKQIQHLLAYLGYYGGEIDGIYGDLTLNAVIRFQDDFVGLAVDGKAGPDTQKALRHTVAYGLPEREAQEAPESGDFWDKVRYFKREEFRCTCGKCGGFPVEMQEEAVLAFDEIRHRLGVPVSIVDAGGSGVRCKAHNTAVGGAKDSQHLYGLAADLHSEKSPEEMYRVAEETLGDTGGIGIYKWGIHVDKRKTKARWDER